MTSAPHAPGHPPGGVGAPGGITVRPATPDDLATVVDLRLALLDAHDTNLLYRRRRSDARARALALFDAQLRSAREVTLLAELAGEIAGILRCVESAGSPLLYPARYGYVASVYVRPAARRRGVLRALLGEAAAWCRARGLTEMRLHSATGNDTANAVWDGLGFEPVEVLRVRVLDE